MTDPKKPVLVAGATGHQGRAVNRALVVDRSRNRAFLHNRPIVTTKLTFRLLVLLAEAAKIGEGWVSRHEAQNILWWGEARSIRAFDTAVARLRQALKQAGRQRGRDGADLVETKRYVGLRLRLSRDDIRAI